MWFAQFDVRRAKRGTKWCKAKGFGPIREFLEGKSDPPEIAGFLFKSSGWSTADTLECAKDAATLYCRMCGGCELGR